MKSSPPVTDSGIPGARQPPCQKEKQHFCQVPVDSQTWITDHINSVRTRYTSSPQTDLVTALSSESDTDESESGAILGSGAQHKSR
ncbi:UNVERIFIED_CONTAM: hypothetical protein K2H54_059474 [Gekko kuhli]